MLPPFDHNAEANTLLEQRYPSPDEFAQACKLLSSHSRIGVIRLFIAEGVPRAFERLPTLFESVRDFIAQRLSVEPRNITIVGSARIGYSLAPPPHYGTLFNPNSDLDFTLVCTSLFGNLAQVFEQWNSDVVAGRERTRNAREEGFWADNLKRLPQNIRSGFIDPYKIPNRYELSVRLSQTMWLVKERLHRTPSAPMIRRASLRVYRDWDAFSRQQLFNIRDMLSKLGQV